VATTSSPAGLAAAAIRQAGEKDVALFYCAESPTCQEAFAPLKAVIAKNRESSV